MQFKLEEKEKRIDNKYEQLDAEKMKLEAKGLDLEKLIDEATTKLSEVAGLSKLEARDELMKSIEKEYSDIPSEDIKGKVIGREGRNVVFFEKITGVELIIDDTPLIIRLSSYDHEKRWIATEVLKSMIKDGRINPVYIEKTYNDLVANFENLLLEKGKEALNILGMPPQHADITKLVGQFNLRYSYGQNLWIHSVEVAKMCEMLANEMGLDGSLAKKAGLFHDIGKVVAQE